MSIDDNPPGTVPPSGTEPYEPPVAEDLDTAEGTVAAASWVTPPGSHVFDSTPP